MSEPGKWQQRLAQKQAAASAAGTATSAYGKSASKAHASESTKDAAAKFLEAYGDDTVPATEDTSTAERQERVDTDAQLDKLISSIGILQGYTRWVGKQPLPSPLPGQVESILCRCPVPGHNDANPSAWINTQKNTWYCAACEQGGDTWDLAAMKYGVQDNYKVGKGFHDLRRLIGGEFGWEFIRASNGDYIGIPPSKGKPKVTDRWKKAAAPKGVAAPAASTTATQAAAPASATTPAPATPAPQSIATVVNITEAPSLNEDNDLPDMNWREVFTEPSFIKTYMEETSQDDVPEMYHMAHALMGLGLSLGRNVTLQDQPNVYGNLFICILGKTSEGKSKSRRYIEHVIGEALPYDKDQPIPDGAKVIKSPSSGEGLVGAFRRMLPDPRNPKWFIPSGDVRGLVDYGELGDITGKAARLGNTLKYTLLDFYDCSHMVGYTTKGDGEVIAQDAFCSVLTTCQPDRIGELLDQGDNSGGFLNRWNFFTGSSKVKKALHGFNMDLDQAVDDLKEIHDWADTGRSIQWSPEAELKFTEFFYGVIQPTRAMGNDEILGRADLTIKKLILLMAANRLDDVVTPQAVEQAIAFWPYLLECYRLIDSRVGTPPMNELEERIHKMLQNYQTKHNDFMSVGVLKNRMRKVTSDELFRSLSNLEKSGELKRHEPKAGGVGRPSEKWEAIVS